MHVKPAHVCVLVSVLQGVRASAVNAAFLTVRVQHRGTELTRANMRTPCKRVKESCLALKSRNSVTIKLTVQFAVEQEIHRNFFVL